MYPNSGKHTRYSYLADGTKLRVRDNGEVTGFDYTGSLTYRKSSVGLQLESVNFGSGVIRVTGSTGNQQELNYFLTDHLGSVRVIVDSLGRVLERNDYYAFGAGHVRSDYPRQVGNRFKYNGQEEQVTGDLGFLDYGWRMHDKSLGRWFCMDRLSEMMPSVSCYSYVMNNPVRYRDLFGLATGDGDGSILLDEVIVKPRKPSLHFYTFQPVIRPYNFDISFYDRFSKEGLKVLHELASLKDQGSIFLGAVNTWNGLLENSMTLGVRTSFETARTWSSFRKLTPNEKVYRTNSVLGKYGYKTLKGVKFASKGVAAVSSAISFF